MKKIGSLEGIRTIGCISVFLCHFRLAFLPGRTFWLIDSTPLRILTDGNKAVRILFVLSGFVVCYKYFMGESYERVPRDIVKRYFRLAPSVIVANVLVYILMKLNLLYNVQAAEAAGSGEFLGTFNRFAPSLAGCLKEAFLLCYLKGANGYIGPLWTITYEYLGAILVLCAVYVCRDSALMRTLFYLAVFIAFDSYYNYFVLGMLLCDIYAAQEETGKGKGWRCYVEFIIGCWIVCMYEVNDGIKLDRVVFAVGLALMFMGLLNSAWGERVLGGRAMRAGGKYSYAAYIVHWPILESFSCACYLWMVNLGVDGMARILSCFVLTVPVVLVSAYVFRHYVEEMGRGAIAYIDARLGGRPCA